MDISVYNYRWRSIHRTEIFFFFFLFCWYSGSTCKLKWWSRNSVHTQHNNATTTTTAQTYTHEHHHQREHMQMTRLCRTVVPPTCLNWSFCFYILLGNLPVERAKDAVCFLQWCGVSLVSSYAVCFLQRGGVSLASSAIIYNIVKVNVTRWPFRKRTPQGQLRGPPTYTIEMWPVRPVDLLEKEPLKGNCEVHLHTPLRCSAAKGAELDSAAAAAKQKGPFAAVWREAGAYII